MYVVDEGFVIFRLSKILDLDLGPLLIAEVLFSNVGGTATGNVRVCVCVCVCVCMYVYVCTLFVCVYSVQYMQCLHHMFNVLHTHSLCAAIGDPPVVIMVGHKRVKEAVSVPCWSWPPSLTHTPPHGQGITFAELTAHLLLGTFFIMFVAYATL